MSATVIFAPEAEVDLIETYDFIAGAASPETALAFTTKIIQYCETLALFPDRGRNHDDVRRGLRTISYRRRVLIAYHRKGAMLVIDRILYGGRNFDRAFEVPGESPGGM